MKHSLRILAALLALLFTLSCLCGCLSSVVDSLNDFLSDTETETGAGTDTESVISALLATDELPGRGASYDEMEYVRPDYDAFSEEVDAVYALLDEAEPDADTVLDSFDALKRIFSDAGTMATLAYLRTSQNVNDDTWSEELSLSEDTSTSMANDMYSLASEILSSSIADEAVSRWGSDRAEEIERQAALSSDEISDDLSREQELTNEYLRITTGFTVSYNGEDYTLDDFYHNENLSSDEYQAGVTLYYEKLCEAVGDIFTELVTLRTRMANTQGYDNYAEYAYEGLARDYTLDDAEALADAVKKYAVPLFIKLAWSDFYASDEYEAFSTATYDKNDTLEAFSTAAADFSPELGESVEFMLEKGLCFIDRTENNEAGGYTINLEAYQSPFLYFDWDGSDYSVTGIVHESGHFLNFYRCEEEYFAAVDPIDLSEIDSQALELLFFPYYDDLFGEDCAEAAKHEKLSDMLYSLLSGCLEDEFQRTVYANPDMTVEEISELYGELLSEYGLTSAYIVPAESWAATSHTFQSPLYYISYATSALPALEIWEMSTEDYDAARELYLSLVNRSNMATFRAELSSIGLADPFEESTVKDVCDCIEKTLLD